MEVENNNESDLAYYVRNRDKLYFGINVRRVLLSLRDSTDRLTGRDKLHDQMNRLNISELATRLLDYLDKGELTEDDIPLEWFINLIEDYRQDKITIRRAVILFFGMLDNYRDIIINQPGIQKFDDIYRRRDEAAWLKWRQEKMEGKRKATEWLLFEDMKRELDEIPKNKRPKDNITLDRLSFGLPLHKQKVKSTEIARRWLIKTGQLTEDGSVLDGAKYRKLTQGELKEMLRKEGAIFRRKFSDIQKKT